MSTERNYTSGYNDGSLTRDEALDMIADAANDDRPGDALEALHHLWLGHSEHGYTLSDDLAEYLREYVAEACMDIDGDAIRSDGPKGSDYTGISS